MAKKSESKKENEEIKEEKTEFVLLDDKKSFDIILLPISGMVINETQKNVSGSVANILIKKGFAKLKTT